MSNLKKLIVDYSSYRSGFGYLAADHDRVLYKFLDYTNQHFPNDTLPSKKNIEAFMKTSSTPAAASKNARALRSFGKYLQKRGYSNAYVIVSNRYPQPLPLPPHYFTENEINSFFAKLQEEAQYESELKSGLRCQNKIVLALFTTMYCCGLRTIETRRLERKDVDFKAQYININDSKGPYSRRIWISDELAGFLESYDSLISMHYPNRKFFFPSRQKNCSISPNTIYTMFTKIWDQLYPGTRNNGHPRPYDFRHHVVYYNLNRWTVAGIDANTMIPYLMRFMGHSCVDQLLYYFHLVPSFYDDYQMMTKELEDILPEVEDEEI